MLGNISNIKGGIVEFENMNESTFDAIVFATGYKSTANMWLKVHCNVNVWSFLRKKCNRCGICVPINLLIIYHCNLWLQNGQSVLNNDGLPKKEFPNHWKGQNGLYCAGLAKRGLAGLAMDAKKIANDILSCLASMHDI